MKPDPPSTAVRRFLICPPAADRPIFGLKPVFYNACGSLRKASAPSLPRSIALEPGENLRLVGGIVMTVAARLSNEYPVPERMKAWVLGHPGEILPVEKPVPQPGPAEVLVRIDAVAICATDLEIMQHGLPAMVDGGLPFNKNFTIGHEYMGTVVELGLAVDEYRIGDRVTVEVHAGCGRCERCRQGMYT